MPKIYVHTAFTLRHNGGALSFPVGVHTVDADVASHWYVKAHVGEEPALDLDSGAAADALLAELEERAKVLQDAEVKVAQREQAADAREAKLDEREKAVAQREQAADIADQGAAGKTKPTK